MPEKPRNFLLGRGERLVESINVRGGGGGKSLPYTLEEAQARLKPQVESAVRNFNSLPPDACPDGRVVGVVTLHPQFLAKTFHPKDLLRDLQLGYVGSRSASVTPDKWTRQGDPEAMETSELFVAGSRTAFEAFARRLGERGSFGAESEIRQIESFRSPTIEERQRSLGNLNQEEHLFEVALHLPDPASEVIISSFKDYISRLGAHAEHGGMVRVPGLAFLAIRIPADQADELTSFSFVRVIRPMPRLRALHPMERTMATPGLAGVVLPTQPPVDPELRMAVFDGGLESDSSVLDWASFSGEVPAGPEGEGLRLHGHSVTSAALFGPLTPGQVVPRPYAYVDHYGVVNPEDGPLALYHTLRRITDVLATGEYAFANLSLGPELPIEDDEIHSWTAAIDACLANGKTLFTIAAGNNGALDRESGNARVQVPSDCVNALAVGAADSRRDAWSRASYSAVGPGRSPGMVKPDLLHFGGDKYEPFYFAPAQAKTNGLIQSAGTSFAAPSALRLAAGIRAHFGEQISPLALKALLVHSADVGIYEDSSEPGWGRLPSDIDPFVLCPDRSVRVVYQGTIEPKRYIRMPIPLPEGVDEGWVTISATYCIASATDPRAPGSYTASGIEPTFRPHADVRAKPESIHPKSDSFFQLGDYVPEQTLRNASHKWETVKHKSKPYKASKLHRPAFDLHHVSRLADADGASSSIPYALVITITTPDISDIYDRVVRAFAPRLEIMQPQVEIPIAIDPV